MPPGDEQDGCPGWQLLADLFQVLLEFQLLMQVGKKIPFHRVRQFPGQEALANAAVEQEREQRDQQQCQAGYFSGTPGLPSPGPEMQPGKGAAHDQAGNRQQHVMVKPTAAELDQRGQAGHGKQPGDRKLSPLRIRPRSLSQPPPAQRAGGKEHSQGSGFIPADLGIEIVQPGSFLAIAGDGRKSLPERGHPLSLGEDAQQQREQRQDRQGHQDSQVVSARRTMAQAFHQQHDGS